MLDIVSSCVTLSLRRAIFSDIRLQKMSWPWNPGQSSLTVIERGTVRQIAYDFVLVFYRNFFPKFLTYSTSKMPRPWQLVYWSVNVIRNVTMRHSAYDFLLTFYSNYGSVACRFWDIQCWKMLWPWNRFQSHSRSLKVVLLDRLSMVSY